MSATMSKKRSRHKRTASTRFSWNLETRADAQRVKARRSPSTLASHFSTWVQFLLSLTRGPCRLHPILPAVVPFLVFYLEKGETLLLRISPPLSPPPSPRPQPPEGPPDVTHLQPTGISFVLKDHDAVIKMMINGWSSLMRHISRSHRVNLDWLFDRINLDPGTQIKYVFTSKQTADILITDSFSRERWTQFTQLFILMTPHMHSCSRLFGVIICTTRRQDVYASCRTYHRKPYRQRPVLNA